jgi:hypothetical protein
MKFFAGFPRIKKVRRLSECIVPDAVKLWNYGVNLRVAGVQNVRSGILPT